MMEKLLDLTKDDNSGEEWQASPPHVSINIPSVETESACLQRRKLHRVLPQMRENKKHIYDPVVLSFGPYHHGESQFHQVEQLKEEILHKMLENSNVKALFHHKIRARVDEIRSFYGGISMDEYDDNALAEMMLRDACFVLCYIQMVLDIDNNMKYYSLFLNRLGRSRMAFMDRDYFMLENQIPFWVIKLLINLKFHDKDEEEALLCKFLSVVSFGDHRMTRLPWRNKCEEPLHLLEAQRAFLLEKESGTINESARRQQSQIFKFGWGRSKISPNTIYENESSPFRSVAELKAKGIHFGPSSNCLQDIRFSSYSFYGKLHLPVWLVTNNSKVFFSNIIAFEMSQETDTNCAVTSYVNFMKTLIENPKDVKELREKGILFSCLPNDEDVVKMFKDLDTNGINNGDIFQDVKIRIKEHCANKAKTWMAEFADNYCHRPWKAIALFAAIYLLFLASLQTYYTVYPK